MGVVELTAVDGIARDRDGDGNQSWNVRGTVIADAEQGQLVTPEVELAQPVQLVLLAMLQALQKSVAERNFHRDPFVDLGLRRTPTGHKVSVAIVAGELNKADEMRPGNVVSGQIDSIVTLANVESAAINRHRFNDRRDEHVGIGIAVAMSIGGKVVGKKEGPDLKILRDGLAMISGHAGRKILRRFNSARRGFNRQAGYGNGRSGAAGIGVEHLIVNDHRLRGIGRLQRRNGSDDRNLLLGRN